MSRLLPSIPLLIVATHSVIAAENPDIVLYVGEPQQGTTYQGIANLRGWAVAPTIPLDRIEAWITEDDKLQVPLGGYRSDVASSPDYGHYPNAENSGFSMAFNYGNYGAGNHTLTVRVYDINGDWTEQSINFEIASFPDPFIDTLNEVVELDPLNAEVLVQDGDGFRINGLNVEGIEYDLNLRWRESSQGFAIESIEPTDPGLTAYWDNEREVIVIEDATATSITLGTDFNCELGRIEQYPTDSTLGANAILFRTPYHATSGADTCSGSVNRTLADGSTIPEFFSFELGNLDALSMLDTFARIGYTYRVLQAPSDLQHCTDLSAFYINENALDGAQAGTQISAYNRPEETWGLANATDCARYYENYELGLPSDPSQYEFDKGGNDLLMVDTEIQTENAYKAFVFRRTTESGETESMYYTSVWFPSLTEIRAERQYQDEQGDRTITFSIQGIFTNAPWPQLSNYEFLFTVYNHTDSCNSPQSLSASIDDGQLITDPIEPGAKAEVSLLGGDHQISYQLSDGSLTDSAPFTVDDDTNWKGWGCDWEGFTPYSSRTASAYSARHYPTHLSGSSSVKPRGIATARH